MDPDYPVKFWQPNIQRILGADASVVAARPGADAFSVEWMTIESDGNVCAIGRIDQTAADGSNAYPREMGIGQAYNPDDLKAQGVSAAALRAYCQPPSVMQQLTEQYMQAYAVKDSATMHTIMVKAQTKTRMLTSAEIDQQIRATLTNKIIAGVAKADATVLEYKLAWNSVDVWKLAKCDHAFPPILNQGMPAVVAKLGRPPASWAEFRSVLGMDHDDVWNSALNACEQCGDATASATTNV